ncbi:MAG: GNAT family N-acetyltransferase [Sphingomicrobium sp.]
MGIEFSVRRFDAEIEGSYLRLFPDDVASKPAELLRWRFRDGPHGPGFFALARDPDAGGAIVGLIGLIATRMQSGSVRIPAFQAVDTVVDPNYRGRGLFVGMGAAAQSETEVHGGRLIWGFPNANAAPGWFGKLGWRRFGTVPFLFKPLRSGYVLGRLAGFLRWVDLPLAWRRGTGTGVRPIARFGAEADRLWEACSAGRGCAVERDSAMLNWRLFERPNSSYRVAGSFSGDGALQSMVAHCILEKHGGRIAYVMEALALPGHEAKLTALLRRAMYTAAREGAEVALAWCPAGAFNRKALRQAGFMTLPEKLRPVDIHFGARELVPDVPPAATDSLAWYLSYLDSDTV